MAHSEEAADAVAAGRPPKFGHWLNFTTMADGKAFHNAVLDLDSEP